MKLQIKMLNFVYIQGASINKWCIARFIWNTKVTNTYFSDESPYFSILLKPAKELALLKLELQINRANVHKNILLYCKSLIIGILAIHLNFSWKISIIQVNKCSVMNLKNSIISGFFFCSSCNGSGIRALLQGSCKLRGFESRFLLYFSLVSVVKKVWTGSSESQLETRSMIG